MDEVKMVKAYYLTLLPVMFVMPAMFLLEFFSPTAQVFIGLFFAVGVIFTLVSHLTLHFKWKLSPAEWKAALKKHQLPRYVTVVLFLMCVSVFMVCKTYLKMQGSSAFNVTIAVLCMGACLAQLVVLCRIRPT